MLTRKHFAGIASCVEAVRGRAHSRTGLNYTDQQLWAVDAALEAVATELANELRRHNPNFDRNRFLKACGVEDAE